MAPNFNRHQSSLSTLLPIVTGCWWVIELASRHTLYGAYIIYRGGLKSQELFIFTFHFYITYNFKDLINLFDKIV